MFPIGTVFGSDISKDIDFEIGISYPISYNTLFG